MKADQATQFEVLIKLPVTVTVFLKYVFLQRLAIFVLSAFYPRYIESSMTTL